jgi:hypothetical protein
MDGSTFCNTSEEPNIKIKVQETTDNYKKIPEVHILTMFSPFIPPVAQLYLLRKSFTSGAKATDKLRSTRCIL